MSEDLGRELPKINYVASDIIWKDHVKTEEHATKSWENNWGFMKAKHVDLIKNERPSTSVLEQRTKTMTELSRSGITVRPVTPLEEYVHVEPSPQPLPATIANQIGWRSGDKKCALEKYGKYASPKGGLIKQLGWPAEAVD